MVLESAQAREDRKKRKELKKLAKANVTGAIGTPSATSPTSATFAVPTPGSSTGPASSPKPSRPPPVQIPSNADIARGSTPRATPTSAVSQQQSIPSAGEEKRGKKRDHDEVTRQQQQQGPVVQNSNQNGMLPKAGIGKGGIKPRPIKKQRMVGAWMILCCLTCVNLADEVGFGWAGERYTRSAAYATGRLILAFRIQYLSGRFQGARMILHYGRLCFVLFLRCAYAGRAFCRLLP